ncbi:hypothetical protein TRFO_33471 [Tritrichomonas foetus]|uniref:Uncharacterized protein n=1 Tax=Tritrichomonas foetus TaxID=1144522 RepID=A0A1J4JLH4_9EUKA|nr:hypothetical protein TRFO_33471 [Tritrichomonas foetus]|eukprot:OHS99960.1 hypothetical protein TRFO_33471 [Tritrichomonas foetus]
MSSPGSTKELKPDISKEEIKEEEEEEDNNEPKDEGERYDRKRFNYPDMYFDNISYYDKVVINHSQYGHKKYSYYTEHGHKEASVRTIVRNLPRFNRKLDDPAPLKQKGKKKIFSKFLSISFFIITCVIGYIHQYHTPETVLLKIQSSTEMAQDRVGSLHTYLANPHLSKILIIDTAIKVGQLLNEPSLVNLTFEEMRNNNIIPLIYKTIKSESSTNEEYYSQRTIQYLFSLLHDISISGSQLEYINPTYTKMLIRSFPRLFESHVIYQPFFSFFIVLANTPEGRDQIKGTIKPMVNSITNVDFELISQYLAMRFLAYYSIMGSPFEQEDEMSICKYVDYISKYSDHFDDRVRRTLDEIIFRVDCAKYKNRKIANEPEMKEDPNSKVAKAQDRSQQL